MSDNPFNDVQNACRSVEASFSALRRTCFDYLCHGNTEMQFTAIYEALRTFESSAKSLAETYTNEIKNLLEYQPIVAINDRIRVAQQQVTKVRYPFLGSLSNSVTSAFSLHYLLKNIPIRNRSEFVIRIYNSIDPGGSTDQRASLNEIAEKYKSAKGTAPERQELIKPLLLRAGISSFSVFKTMCNRHKISLSNRKSRK